MKRLAAVLALTTLAACGGGGTSRRDVIVRWEFLRHTLTAQADGQFEVRYDPTDPDDGTFGECPESGVSYVTITDAGGRVVNPERPQIDCTYSGVHGAIISDIRVGQHTWTVTGYRSDGVATFASDFTFDVTRGGANEFVVSVEGIRDELDVFATFTDALGGNPSSTCGDAGLATGFLEYTLSDGAGTVVATGEVPCTDPPGVSFQAATTPTSALDRDDYTVRLRAFADARVQVPLFDSSSVYVGNPSCQARTFQHLGPQFGASAVDVVLYDVRTNPTTGQPSSSFCAL